MQRCFWSTNSAHGFFEALQRWPDLTEQPMAVAGKHELARKAMEQLAFKMPFQVADLLTHGALCETELRCGARETPLARSRFERTKPGNQRWAKAHVISVANDSRQHKSFATLQRQASNTVERFRRTRFTGFHTTVVI